MPQIRKMHVQMIKDDFDPALLPYLDADSGNVG